MQQNRLAELRRWDLPDERNEACNLFTKSLIVAPICDQTRLVDRQLRQAESFHVPLHLAFYLHVEEHGVIV